MSCSNCGDPICPDCMVYTPVGVKCEKCARMPKSALIRIKPERVALTAVAGLGAATVGGYVFGLVISMISFFAIFVAFGLGSGVGEAISWASGRHHGQRLAAWAVVCGVFGIIFGIWSVRTGFTVSTLALRYAFTGYSIWGFLWMAAAAYGAWQRNA
ncbi:MAG: hypothetical protein ACYC4D_03700 [Thermoleophilia bacterium]